MEADFTFSSRMHILLPVSNFPFIWLHRNPGNFMFYQKCEAKDANTTMAIARIGSAIQSLQEQHEFDLKIYRSAHAELFNRVLHWIMIPLETFAFLLAAAVVLSRIMPVSSKSNDLAMYSVGWTLGILSLAIAGESIFIGLISFFFHIAAASCANRLVQKLDLMSTVAVAMSTWTMAWILQVGIGHWLLEGNQPNVANITEVSWLAMTQSVLIAWKS